MVDDEDTDGDEHAEVPASASAELGAAVDAAHVEPLPIPVTDSSVESGGFVGFVGSGMCATVSWMVVWRKEDLIGGYK